MMDRVPVSYRHGDLVDMYTLHIVCTSCCDPWFNLEMHLLKLDRFRLLGTFF